MEARLPAGPRVDARMSAGSSSRLSTISRSASINRRREGVGSHIARTLPPPGKAAGGALGGAGASGSADRASSIVAFSDITHTGRHLSPPDKLWHAFEHHSSVVVRRWSGTGSSGPERRGSGRCHGSDDLLETTPRMHHRGSSRGRRFGTGEARRYIASGKSHEGSSGLTARRFGMNVAGTMTIVRSGFSSRSPPRIEHARAAMVR